MCVFPYFSLTAKVFNTVCRGARIYRCHAPAFVRSRLSFKLRFDIISICWLILSSYTYMHICIYNIHICITYRCACLVCSLSCNTYDHIHTLFYVMLRYLRLRLLLLFFLSLCAFFFFLLNILALTLSCFHGTLHRLSIPIWPDCCPRPVKNYGRLASGVSM